MKSPTNHHQPAQDESPAETTPSVAVEAFLQEMPPLSPHKPTNLPAAEQRQAIAYHFGQIMETLGLDLSDDSLAGTPARVAKMFVDELFSGLQAEQEPTITLFENKYNYGEILVEKDIELHSTCEHHFLPIMGKAHVAYIPQHRVVGLSKLNRIVHFFAKRPQVQERLTQQVAHFMMQVLGTPDVAVLMDAKHMCVNVRGVEDPCSSTLTSAYYGQFKEPQRREEFLRYVGY